MGVNECGCAEILTVIPVGVLGARVGWRDVVGGVGALELVLEEALRGDRVASDIAHVAQVELEMAPVVRGDEQLDVAGVEQVRATASEA